MPMVMSRVLSLKLSRLVVWSRMSEIVIVLCCCFIVLGDDDGVPKQVVVKQCLRFPMPRDCLRS